MSEIGIRMTRYKRVRQDLGTLNYLPYQSQRKNPYEPLYRKIKGDITPEHGRKKSRTKQKKRIEITEKKDLFANILLTTQEKQKDQKEKPVTDKDQKEKPVTDKDQKEKSRSFKRIRVTNVDPDKKKGDLVL